MNNKILGFINLHSKTATIFWTTLIAGVLDGLAAIIVYGVFFKYNPIQIYQFVASALLGNEAYGGGVPVAILGLFFHFLIAWVASYLFIQGYPKWSFLRMNKWMVGLCYGLVIWGFMNLVVIPLTKIPASGFDVVAMISIGWHMLLVGLPISLLTSAFYVSLEK